MGMVREIACRRICGRWNAWFKVGEFKVRSRAWTAIAPINRELDSSNLMEMSGLFAAVCGKRTFRGAAMKRCNATGLTSIDLQNTF